MQLGLPLELFKVRIACALPIIFEAPAIKEVNGRRSTEVSFDCLCSTTLIMSCFWNTFSKSYGSLYFSNLISFRSFEKSQISFPKDFNDLILLVRSSCFYTYHLIDFVSFANSLINIELLFISLLRLS